MKKKLLISLIAMLTSITVLTGCNDTTQESDTSTTTQTEESNESTESSDTTEEAPADGEDFIPDEDFLLDMENIEMTEEEIAKMLGFSGDGETVKEGSLSLDFGTSNIDDFDITFNASTFDFNYDGDVWIESGFAIDGTEVVLVDSNPVDFEAPANIYITPMTQIPSYISLNEYLQMVVDSSLSAFGVDVLNSAVDFYGDYEVGMVETVEGYTEELIQEFIELGYFSESDIEEIGGIDVLTSLPDMYQVFMIARNGDEAYTFSGAYYDNDIKRDEIIQAVDGFLQTLTVTQATSTPDDIEISSDEAEVSDNQENTETPASE